MSLWSYLTALWSPVPVALPEIEAFPEEDPTDSASFAALAGRQAPEDLASDEFLDPQLPLSPRPVPKVKAVPRYHSPPVVEPVVPTDLVRTNSGQFADIEFSRDFQVAILKARSPETLGELVPDFLLYLANDPALDSLDPHWHPRARIGRALRAGISARRVLDEEFDKQAQSPALPFRNRIYICLRRVRTDEGWWTESYLVYWQCIQVTGPAEIEAIQDHSVSHAFPTRAEGEAFLRGARRQWPRYLRSATDL